MNLRGPVPTTIPLEEKIARTQRLLRRLEEDQPYMNARLAPLGAEYRQSASAFADRVRAEAEAELQRLMAERGLPPELTVPQNVDETARSAEGQRGDA